MSKSRFSRGFVCGIASTVIALGAVTIMSGFGSGSSSRTGVSSVAEARYDVVPFMGGLSVGVVDHQQGTVTFYSTMTEKAIASGGLEKTEVYSFDAMGDVWMSDWNNSESP